MTEPVIWRKCIICEKNKRTTVDGFEMPAFICEVDLRGKVYNFYINSNKYRLSAYLFLIVLFILAFLGGKLF